MTKRRQLKGHNLRSLRQWLKTHDAEERYNYQSTSQCLAAQYLRHLGTAEYRMPVLLHARYTEPGLSFLARLECIAVWNDARTFGGALELVNECIAKGLK